MKPLHGTFHVPSDPDDKFGGILRRVEGGIEFEAVGWDMVEGDHDVIVGALADGCAVTLGQRGRFVEIASWRPGTSSSPRR